MHSYAATAASPTERARTRSSSTTHVDEQPPMSESATIRANFIAFAKPKLSIALDQCDITAIHELQPRCDGKRPTIVQLLYADKKAEIMMKQSALRGIDVYNRSSPDRRQHTYRESTARRPLPEALLRPVDTTVAVVRAAAVQTQYHGTLLA